MGPRRIYIPKGVFTLFVIFYFPWEQQINSPSVVVVALQSSGSSFLAVLLVLLPQGAREALQGHQESGQVPDPCHCCHPHCQGRPTSAPSSEYHGTLGLLQAESPEISHVWDSRLGLEQIQAQFEELHTLSKTLWYFQRVVEPPHEFGSY